MIPIQTNCLDLFHKIKINFFLFDRKIETWKEIEQTSAICLVASLRCILDFPSYEKVRIRESTFAAVELLFAGCW